MMVQVTQGMSPQQIHPYELILLMMANITLKQCNTLNPFVILLPLLGEETAYHDSVVTTHEAEKA